MPNNLSKKEIKDIIQWDVKNWKNALSFWEAHFPVKPGMRVLALGERQGGLSLYFALKGCEVICSDFMDFPAETQQMHQHYGVADKITYAKIDMRAIDFADNTFDVVVFKSVIGVLPLLEDRNHAIDDIKRVLKKDGAFLFAENSSASFLHRFARKKFVKWEDKWFYLPDSEIDSWKRKFSTTHSGKYGFIGVFSRSERQRNFLGAIDVVLSRLMPLSWRYIYFGVFRK